MAYAHHLSHGFGWQERAGDGPAVIFLHGIGSKAASFDLLWPHLPENWHLVAWDAPGYGGSDALNDPWPQAQDYADALMRFLDMRQVSSAILCGHSLGALMAGAALRHYPDRFSRLVLAAPACGHEGVRHEALNDKAQLRLDELARLGPAGFAQARAPGLIDRPAQNPALVALIARHMAQIRPDGYQAATRMLAVGRLCDDLARCTRKCDVIVGENDPITPPSDAKRAYAHLPATARGRYLEIPDAGHALYVQQPADFAAALISCLEPSFVLKGADHV